MHIVFEPILTSALLTEIRCLLSRYNAIKKHSMTPKSAIIDHSIPMLKTKHTVKAMSCNIAVPAICPQAYPCAIAFYLLITVSKSTSQYKPHIILQAFINYRYSCNLSSSYK